LRIIADCSSVVVTLGRGEHTVLVPKCGHYHLDDKKAILISISEDIRILAYEKVRVIESISLASNHPFRVYN
jgi:hypothetical protein